MHTKEYTSTLTLVVVILCKPRYSEGMQKNIHVGLYGRRSTTEHLGHFASEIYNALQVEPNVTVYKLDFDPAPQLDAVIYASRSADKLRQASELCIKEDIPLLILSSDMGKEISDLSDACKIQVIPNSSLEVQEYQQNITKFHENHPDYKVSITEYHQQSKADVSGTAIDIAKQINFDGSKITSVRDDLATQKKFNIPEEFKQAYAIHQITFTNPETNVSQMFEIKVYGRKTYTESIGRIIKRG